MLSLVLKGERPTTKKPRGVHPGAWPSAQPSIRRDGLRRRGDGSKLHAARIADVLVSARAGGGGRRPGGAAQLLAQDPMRRSLPMRSGRPEPDHPGTGHNVSVQMRDSVSQGQVVHLDRVELLPHRASYREHFLPVPARLLGTQVGRFRDMPVSPHHDAVARQAAPSLQVHLGELASKDRHPIVVVTRPRAAQIGHPRPAIRSSQSSGHPRSAMTYSSTPPSGSGRLA
jgi:hypothetical protein